MGRDHTTVRIGSVEIDEVIAPLIEGLWRRGVQTTQCCQESMPGFVWIAFPDIQQANAFLRALALHDPSKAELDDYYSLASRCNGWTVASPGGGWPEEWAWRWSILLDPTYDDVSGVAVDFPLADLPELIRRVSSL